MPPRGAALKEGSFLYGGRCLRKVFNTKEKGSCVKDKERVLGFLRALASALGCAELVGTAGGSPPWVPPPGKGRTPDSRAARQHLSP